MQRIEEEEVGEDEAVQRHKLLTGSMEQGLRAAIDNRVGERVYGLMVDWRKERA